MPKLTKRAVDAIKPTGRDFVVWDAELASFGLRVKPSGAKSFVIQYRNARGVSRRLTLGQYGPITPEEARALAMAQLGRVAKDKTDKDKPQAAKADPAEEKRRATTGATVADLCADYLKTNEGMIKASTLKMDRSRINCHVLPLLGSRRISSLSRRDIEQFQADITKGKTAKKPPKSRKGKGRGGLATGGATVASRTVGMLGTILQRAVDVGVIAQNPVRGVRRPKDKVRRPPFSFELVEQFGRAMREARYEGENPTGLHAIRALLLSGCRREEILAVHKTAIDFKDHCVRFEDTKGGWQMRALGESALAHFHPLVAEGKNPFVFPTDAPTDADEHKHFVGLPDVLTRVGERAGVPKITIHWLRHWFSSAAAALGYSEIIIAALVGHKLKGVTHRYARAPDPALVAAADRISRRLADALDGKVDADNVVPLKRLDPARNL